VRSIARNIPSSIVDAFNRISYVSLVFTLLRGHKNGYDHNVRVSMYGCTVLLANNRVNY